MLLKYHSARWLFAGRGFCRLKTAIKKFEGAAAEGNRTEADGAYKVAVKKVDQAVAKGILHKNTAAHRKSAMTLKLNQLG